MTDINRLIASLKRRSAHAKEFGDSITFVKLEDLDALIEALEKAQQLETKDAEMVIQISKRLAEAYKRVTELESEVKFPGVMRCNACGFSRTHVIATPDGMRAGKSEPENCPNGCGPMWHDTYRRQYDELHDAYTALRESNAQVIKSRDHYKRMSEEGLKQLAESRTVTVKLPEPFKMAKSSSGLTYYYADEVNEALTAQGIKWEA